MSWSQIRVVVAASLALVVALAISAPSYAEQPEGEGGTVGTGGTGGAAGNSPPLPDMSRSMGAPSPDAEAPSAEAPEPMNAPPPTDEEKKDESTPAPDDTPKTK